MQLSKMIIFSARPEDLSDFLCQMFDTEMTPCVEGILHHSKIINFEIRKQSNNKAVKHNSNSDFLEFFLDEDEDLEIIKQKIEFFCYKKEIEPASLIVEDCDSHVLMKDMDERNWKFSLSH